MPDTMVQGYLVSGTIHVHKAGCADIKRSRLPQQSDSSGIPEDAPTELALVESWYADMIDEHAEYDGYETDPVKAADVVNGYIGEFHVYPCVSWL